MKVFEAVSCFSAVLWKDLPPFHLCQSPDCAAFPKHVAIKWDYRGGIQVNRSSLRMRFAFSCRAPVCFNLVLQPCSLAGNGFPWCPQGYKSTQTMPVFWAQPPCRLAGTVKSPLQCFGRTHPITNEGNIILSVSLQCLYGAISEQSHDMAIGARNLQ